MVNIESYKHTQLLLLSESQNCSNGVSWIWEHASQCLENSHQILGFCALVTATIMCSVFYGSLFRYHKTHSNHAHKHKCRAKLFRSLHCLSDVIGFTGAILALQLPIQIMFGFSLCVVETMCCLHGFVKSRCARKQTEYREIQRKKSPFKRCIYSLWLLLPIVSMFVILSKPSAAIERSRAVEDRAKESQLLLFDKRWLLGYVLGIIAGILHCLAQIVDVLDSYSSTEFSSYMIITYLFGAVGELLYVVGVFLQRSTYLLIYHTIPWTLPRIISVGLTTGILCQRLMMKKHVRKRKLSGEDAKCLLSSDIDDEFSSSASEEVIWLPLKLVDESKPRNPVGITRVQLISESDELSEDMVNGFTSFSQEANAQSSCSVLQETTGQHEGRAQSEIDEEMDADTKDTDKINSDATKIGSSSTTTPPFKEVCVELKTELMIST